MNWEAIGATAELLASITVIVTLIYLATQVRQANTNLRVAAARDIANTQNTWLRSLRSDEKMLSIYREGLKDREALPHADRARFDFLLLELFNDGDVHYHQYLAGALEEEQWQALARSFTIVIDSPGGYAAWDQWKGMSSKSFMEYVDGQNLDRK